MASNPSAYVKDEQGATFIAASQRPDGTWRKPRRVREGYVPQEEVPLYESKGKQFAKHQPQYPVGLSPEIINAAKAKKEKAARSPIPGLVLDSSTEAKSSKKKKKKKSGTTVDELSDNLLKTQLSPGEVNSPSTPTTPEAPATTISPSTPVTPADPAKRVKNLRKRLREIESIDQKILSGELKCPEKDQLDKLARKQDVLSEIEQLSQALNIA